MPSSNEYATKQAAPPSSAIPDKENHTERVIGKGGLREFLVVDRTASLRKNSKISAIWEHSEERRRLDDNFRAQYWRCAYYTDHSVLLKVDRNRG